MRIAGVIWTTEHRAPDGVPLPTYTTVADAVEFTAVHRDCPCGYGWHLVVQRPFWVHCSGLNDPQDIENALLWASTVIAASETVQAEEPAAPVVVATVVEQRGRHVQGAWAA